MLIHAKIAKQNVAESAKNFEVMQRNYWNELIPALNETISNVSREAMSAHSTFIDKRYVDHVKQKLSEGGYSCTVHPSSKSDSDVKITIGWE